MAASKTTRGTQKKRASKAKTRFYVVNTVQEARSSLTDKLDDYNRKYIVEPLKTGKNFVHELKAEPRKAVVTLLDGGKARISDLNKEVRTRVDGLTREGQQFLTRAGKHPRETFNELIDEGKELVDELRSNTREKIEDLVVDLKIIREGVEKDTRLVLDDVIDGGRKVFGWVPGTLNLPSKKDVTRLERQVKSLNAKVESLGKAQAA